MTKNKPGGFNRWSVLFNAIISQGELMEIQLSGRRYTWSNNHENPTYELLDRVLVSPSWEDTFPLVTVTALSRELSDHTPLLISTGVVTKNPRQFKFENCWFLRPDLEDIVTKVWGQSFNGKDSLDIWHNKSKKLRQTLKGWNANIESAAKKQKKSWPLNLTDWIGWVRQMGCLHMTGLICSSVDRN